MKKTFTMLILFCAPLFAQNYKSGSITGTTCFGIDTTNAGTIGISVQNSSTGSAWSGTIQPSASIGGDPAGNIQVTPSTGGAAQSTITANGVYIVAASGYTYVQVCGNTVTNTAAIKMFPAQYSKNIGGSGGSGSGTVSANNTVAGAVANYAAAGGSTTVGPTTLNYVAPTLTVSTAAGGNGVLALSGNTSGTATFTAPAVAGTSTNGVTMTNVLLAPNGAQATPAYSFSGSTGTGMYQASNALSLISSANSNAWLTLNASTFVQTSNSGSYSFSSAGSPLAAGSDTGISRTAAGVLAMGNGNAGDESALARWNTCKITADITLPVNTATTVCTWNLPSIAKAWAWQCQIPWVISAGTGTNTLAVIANASQTPTGTTNGSAEIKTTNTNTATEATTAISASGATTLLTSGTITPAATVFMSSTSGTLLASATAGTFSIQMIAAGTTATAAAKAGSTCELY